MLKHISEDQLALYLGGDLPSNEAGTVKHHLNACLDCRSTLDDLEQSRALLSTVIPEPDSNDLFEVRTAVVAKLTQRRSNQKHWKWGMAAAVAAIAVILPLRFAQKPAAPPRPQPSAPLPILAATRPAQILPPLGRKLNRSTVRRNPINPGIRTADLITRAGQPGLLRISTSDPNVVILWQFNEKTQNP